MAKYQVDWTKTYHVSGQEIVEGVDSKDEAERQVRDRIGDLTGSMQYDADADEVSSIKIFQNLK